MVSSGDATTSSLKDIATCFSADMRHVREFRTERRVSCRRRSAMTVAAMDQWKLPLEASESDAFVLALIIDEGPGARAVKVISRE